MTRQQIIFRHAAEKALQGVDLNTEVGFLCPFCNGDGLAYKGDDGHHAFCICCKQRIGGFYVLRKAKPQTVNSEATSEALAYLSMSREERIKHILLKAGCGNKKAEKIAKSIVSKSEQPVTQVSHKITLTEREAKLALKYHKQGLSRAAIHKKIDCNYDALCHWYTDNGITPNTHYPKTVIEDGTELLKYYNKGYSICDISYKIGKTEGAVREWLKANVL